MEPTQTCIDTSLVPAWAFKLVCAGCVAVFILFATPCDASTISLTGSLDPKNPNDVLLDAVVLSGPSLTVQSYHQ